MKVYGLQIIFLLGLTGCGGTNPTQTSEEVTQIPAAQRSGSLPLEINTPSGNPTTNEKVTLGRLLFWDPILSGGQDVACASCHHPDNAYAENLDISIGVGGVGLSSDRSNGMRVKRNSQTILNTAYNGINEALVYDPENTVMFWDNRADSLESQALDPIRSESEMRGTHFTEEEIIDVIVNRLSSIPEYTSLFNDAFGDSNITDTKISQAIAAFERTLTANNSPFDRYARGDDSALTEQEIRGLNAFNEAGCNVCHSGPMFSDFELHELPVEHNNQLAEQDLGQAGKFRTPSLRNVTLTAPYMHNGTITDLTEAIIFYDDIDNPSNDPDLAQLDFDDDNQTVNDILSFLGTLTDENFDKTIPERVPSGLNPGGDI